MSATLKRLVDMPSFCDKFNEYMRNGFNSTHDPYMHMLSAWKQGEHIEYDEEHPDESITVTIMYWDSPSHAEDEDDDEIYFFKYKAESLENTSSGQFSEWTHHPDCFTWSDCHHFQCYHIPQ
jgi:hypothetical protein